MFEAVETLVDSMTARLRRRYGINRLQIVSYPGFCNHESVFVRGRVLVGQEVEGGDLEHGRWRNFGNMAKRFLSAEIRHARLVVAWQGRKRDITTDHEGYFFERLPYDPGLSVDMVVRSNEPNLGAEVEVRPEVFEISSKAKLLVVSDMDDTVLLTMATRALRMVALTLFGNAHTRRPFSGVPQFYRQLQAGRTGDEQNPIFYVSSSPWNLYDFLEEFLEVNGIPLGPMFLRDHGLEHRKFGFSDHRSHKIRAIHRLLEVFPDRPMLLVGDTGQKDPEIYREVVEQYRDRIAGVLLRNVSHLLPVRVLEVERIGKGIEKHGVPFRLFDRTPVAADAAREWGLIR